MLAIHAHSPKLWKHLNALLRELGGSKQRLCCFFDIQPEEGPCIRAETSYPIASFWVAGEEREFWKWLPQQEHHSKIKNCLLKEELRKGKGRKHKNSYVHAHLNWVLRLKCWYRIWGLALTKTSGYVFGLESKPQSSFPSNERSPQDESIRNVDERFG